MPIKPHIGLSIITNGRDVSGSVMPWDEYLERVTTAAQKPKSVGGCTIANLKRGGPEPLLNVRPERQCDFKHTKGAKAGHRCRRWAMKGARRCYHHGGMRQNPEHPSAVKRLHDALHIDAGRKAAQSLKDAPPKARATVEQALRDNDLPLRVQTVAAGVDAYQRDDNGRAWRRWLKEAKKARPSDN